MQIIKTIKGWFSKKEETPQQEDINVQQEEVIEIAQAEIPVEDQTLTDEVVDQKDDEQDFMNALSELLALEELPPVPEVESAGFCKIVFNQFFTEWVQPTDMQIPSAWREENKATAKALLDEYGDALTLFFTGTVESQVMLLSFVDAGKIPRVYTVNFQNDQSISPQTSILVKYYQQLDFKMRVVDVDGVAFWTNTAPEYTSSLGIISSNEALRRWGSTSAAGVPVMAGAFPHLQKFDDKWFMGDHEQYFIMDKMVADAGMQVVPSFVKSTPAQLSSYIADATKFAEESGATSTFDIRAFAQAAYPEHEIIERELTDEEKEFEKLARQVQPGRISICWHEVRK